MMHTNYQPAKPGLYDQQIASAKATRAVVNHRKNISHDGMDSLVATLQHMNLRYSDRGDFTRCYRGGF